MVNKIQIASLQDLSDYTNSLTKDNRLEILYDFEKIIEIDGPNWDSICVNFMALNKNYLQEIEFVH